MVCSPVDWFEANNVITFDRAHKDAGNSVQFGFELSLRLKTTDGDIIGWHYLLSLIQAILVEVGHVPSHSLVWYL